MRFQVMALVTMAAGVAVGGPAAAQGQSATCVYQLLSAADTILIGESRIADRTKRPQADKELDAAISGCRASGWSSAQVVAGSRYAVSRSVFDYAQGMLFLQGVPRGRLKQVWDGLSPAEKTALASPNLDASTRAAVTAKLRAAGVQEELLAEAVWPLTNLSAMAAAEAEWLQAKRSAEDEDE